MTGRRGRRPLRRGTGDVKEREGSLPDVCDPGKRLIRKGDTVLLRLAPFLFFFLNEETAAEKRFEGAGNGTGSKERNRPEVSPFTDEIWAKRA